MLERCSMLSHGFLVSIAGVSATGICHPGADSAGTPPSLTELQPTFMSTGQR